MQIFNIFCERTSCKGKENLKSLLAVTFATILFLFIFSALASTVTALQDSRDWPMFRADPSHSGVGMGNPVLTATVLWNYSTGGQIYSSPAVVGGVVYIGSLNGNIYALKANTGTKLWTYTTGGPVYSCPAIF